MLDKKSIVFLVKFFAIFGFFQWILFVVDTAFVQVFIAQIQGWLLDIPVKENLVFVQDQPYAIVSSCTGLVSAIILGAIIFSLKKPEIGKKIIVFLTGTLLLFGFNILRVYFVLLTGIYFGIFWAETVHVASWFAMSGTVIAAWYFFTKKMTGVKSFDGFI